MRTFIDDLATENVIKAKKWRRPHSPWKEAKSIIEEVFWNLRRIRIWTTKKFYKFRNNNYGLLEAIFFPTTLRFFLAYSAVTRRILERKRISSILEVGSGGPGISYFLDPRKYRICLTDIEVKSFYQAKNGVDLVVVDGCKLPFKDNSYDLAVSVDTIEHVPKAFRKDFLQELKRVAKNVIINVPLTDDKGMFKARQFDFLFNKMHRKLHGTEDGSISEHIRCVHPTINELREEFPNAIFEGLEHCNTRYVYTMLARSSTRLFTGLIYLMFLKKRNYQPPYYSCVVIYHKEQQ